MHRTLTKSAASSARFFSRPVAGIAIAAALCLTFAVGCSATGNKNYKCPYCGNKTEKEFEPGRPADQMTSAAEEKASAEIAKNAPDSVERFDNTAAVDTVRGQSEEASAVAVEKYRAAETTISSAANDVKSSAQTAADKASSAAQTAANDVKSSAQTAADKAKSSAQTAADKAKSETAALKSELDAAALPTEGSSAEPPVAGDAASVPPSLSSGSTPQSEPSPGVMQGDETVAEQAAAQTSSAVQSPGVDPNVEQEHSADLAPEVKQEQPSGEGSARETESDDEFGSHGGTVATFGAPRGATATFKNTVRPRSEEARLLPTSGSARTALTRPYRTSGTSYVAKTAAAVQRPVAPQDPAARYNDDIPTVDASKSAYGARRAMRPEQTAAPQAPASRYNDDIPTVDASKTRRR